MADDQMFQEAIEAIRNGQRNRARDLLNRLLRVDNNNVDYWLYMSAVFGSKKERKVCLENVLKYDSTNKTAAQGLIMLGALPPDDALVPVKLTNERDWEVGKVLDASGMVTEVRKPTTKLFVAWYPMSK